MNDMHMLLICLHVNYLHQIANQPFPHMTHTLLLVQDTTGESKLVR